VINSQIESTSDKIENQLYLKPSSQL